MKPTEESLRKAAVDDGDTAVHVLSDFYLDQGDVRGEVLALMLRYWDDAIQHVQYCCKREADLYIKAHEISRYPIMRHAPWSWEPVTVPEKTTAIIYSERIAAAFKEMVAADTVIKARLVLRFLTTNVNILRESGTDKESSYAPGGIYRPVLRLAEGYLENGEVPLEPAYSSLVSNANPQYYERIIELGKPIEREDTDFMNSLVEKMKKAFKKAGVRTPTLGEESIALLRETFGDKPFRWSDAANALVAVSNRRYGKKFQYSPGDEGPGSRIHGDQVLRWLKPVAEKVKMPGRSRLWWQFKKGES